MSTFAIPHGLLGLVRLLATVISAGWVHSPMSWSSDGRWLSYTVVSESPQEGRAAGWIFDTTRDAPANPPAAAPPPAAADARGSVYRIWASQPDGEASALIEESAWPLTAPAWSSRGKALAFGRFVPETTGEAGPAATPRGRFEVVIQEGFNRRRTVLAVPGLELDDATRRAFPHVAPAWSPDGQFLAVPRPGPTPSLMVVKVDARQLMRTVDHALLPAWSPDGSKLAYLHQDDTSDYSLHLLEHQGQTFTGPRAVLPVGQVAAPLFWDEDGRSLMGLIERNHLRFPDLELVNIRVTTGEELKLLPIAPEVLRRGGRSAASRWTSAARRTTASWRSTSKVAMPASSGRTRTSGSSTSRSTRSTGR